MTTHQNDSLLSSSTRVSRYRRMEERRDAKGITKFVQERFRERYIDQFWKNGKKHGFIMMAASCLMIEALESFWQGWAKSPNSGLAFCRFFERNPRFDAIRGLGQEFYTHVRCGIMHQGETTGGWQIRRDLRRLFDQSTKTIDANYFVAAMNRALSDYCSVLEHEPWDSEVWKKFRRKMNNGCANTQSRE